MKIIKTDKTFIENIIILMIILFLIGGVFTGCGGNSGSKNKISVRNTTDSKGKNQLGNFDAKTTKTEKALLDPAKAAVQEDSSDTEANLANNLDGKTNGDEGTFDLILPIEGDGVQGASESKGKTPEEKALVNSNHKGGKVNAENGILEIKEKMFVAQTNEIYINFEDYMGKTIKYEGIFDTIEYPGEVPVTYLYVFRYGPGCCGFDNNAGFEVIVNENTQGSIPDQGSWVEVIGKLDFVEDQGEKFIVVNLDSIKVQEKRGKEYVTQ